MAKTIMISNEIYGELKKIKDSMSFTETIKNLLENKKEAKKTGAGLRDCLGLLKRDKEWEEIEKELKRGWKRWDKRYV